MRLPVGAHPVFLVGAALATATAALFLVFVLLDVLGLLTNPYAGLLVFVTIPLLFVVGLLLMPFGAWLTRRRGGAPDGAQAWPVIDLRNPRHRTVAVSVLALTLVNIVIVSIAAYGGVHYMESTAFCAQACHTTMEPQAVAHQAWPHARVACTQCHVGPGPGAFLEAKLAGTRQLFQVMTGNIPRPVLPPDQLIGEASATCGGCHSGVTAPRDTLRVVRDYGDDEANSETVTTLRLHVGSATAGIHRHNSLVMEYPAAERHKDTISWVRARYPDGTVREFRTAGGAAGTLATGRLRVMDCVDCHNRPAHTFSFSPQRAVDAAIADSRIPRDLPFARREALAAVSAHYADKDAALAGIASHLNDFYATRPAAGSRLVQRAIAGTQETWTRNVFPAMRVAFGTYPSYLGHADTPGCFRCHDDGHTAADGAVITQDCALCHTVE